MLWSCKGFNTSTCVEFNPSEVIIIIVVIVVVVVVIITHVR